MKCSLKYPRLPSPVPSDALTRWRHERCEVLDSLEAFTLKLLGGLRDRRTVTEHLTLALFVRLLLSFRAFATFHDDAAIRIVFDLPDGFAARVPVLLAVLVKGRKLDRGNAAPGNIGADFGNLGMSLWPAVYAKYPVQGARGGTLYSTG